MGTVTNSGNGGDITFEDKLQIKDGDTTGRRGTYNIKLAAQRWDEDMDSRTDTTGNQQSLNAAERSQVNTMIANMANKATVAVFEDREILKDFVQKEYDRACIVAGTLRTAIQDRITEALVEVQEMLDKRRDELARTAGSSRNCYVQDTLSETMTDAMRKFAGLAAEFDFKGIEHESIRISVANQNQMNARLGLTNANMADLFGLWNVLKGSNIDTVGHREHDEDSDRTTFNAEGNRAYTEYAEDKSTASGTYASDRASQEAQGAAVKIASIVPTVGI